MIINRNSLILNCMMVLFVVSCKSISLIAPPQFDYQSLTDNFFNKPSSAHFPLTVNRGASLHPVSIPSGYLFYTTNRDGSGDIWVRSLQNTINVPVIQHPSEQNFPALPENGNRLVYVSYDKDSRGDLMIVDIDPKELEEGALNGLSPVNYWEDSHSLSTQIIEKSQSMKISCQGEFSEKEPVFSKDGKYLFYLSDRCNKGLNNIWVVQLNGDEIFAGPYRLSSNGASQISISKNMKHLVFVSEDSSGTIYGMQLNPFQWKSQLPELKEITLNKSTPQSLVVSPVFSSNGKFLFYQNIVADTNFNGYLDTQDHSGIYRIDLDYTSKGEMHVGTSQQLVESSATVFSLSTSGIIGGALVYAAKLYNSVNIYFVAKEGVVPRKTSIEKQYLFSKSFSNISGGRYLIALESLKNYFGGTKEYKLYEGRVLSGKLQYLQTFGSKAEVDKVQKELNSFWKKSRWGDLDYILNEKKNLSELERIRYLKKYIKEAKEVPGFLSLPKVAMVKLPHVLYQLSLLQKNIRRFDRSLVTIKNLNREFPSYFRRGDSLLHEAWLDSYVNGKISNTYVELLGDKNLRSQYSDRAHFEVYNLLINKSTRFNLIKETKRSDFPALIKATVQLVEAYADYHKGDFTKALGLIDRVIRVVPEENYRGRKRPINEWNGLYVRLWQLKAKIHEKNGDYTALYFDKLTYGAAYNNGSTAAIDESEFVGIVNDSDIFIKNYLQSARDLASLVENTVDAELRNNTISGLLGLEVNPVVSIDSISRNILIDFCKKNSKNSHLFFALGRDYSKKYQHFCTVNIKKLAVEREGGIPLDSIKMASGLLYTGAYAYSNMLNILFFNMKEINVFKNLYSAKAFYYHKLKVDIAKEKHNKETIRSQKLVFVAGQEKALKLLNETDPFDSKVYDELEYGYYHTRAENLKVGDSAMLLGHAYLLITRATEKEKFYEEFQNKGGGLSVGFLRDKKEEILRDFKNAEYVLKYILNIDQENSEAYLMLGWMYQYLDGQQGKVLKLEAGYLDSIYDYFMDSKWIALDKNHYEDYYKKFFDFRFYEANIDLYNRYLEINKKNNIPAEKISVVHLNLANSYFLLHNFRDAIKQYSQVEKYIQKYPSGILGSYKRKALFYLNFGRAYFFEGDSRRASKLLKKSYAIYEKQELEVLNKQIVEIAYLKKNPTKQVSGFNEVRLKNLVRKRKGTYRKLSIILALTGMSDWDSGNYEDSILNYRSSIRNITNNNNNDEQMDLGVDQASLFNFLAMSYQGNERFDKSNEFAKLAASEAKDLFLNRDEKKYEAMTLGGKFLGCILNFGEDFSVVGEGKNPYGFSALRQYELSLGIQFQNRILKGDLDGAYYLMKQRKQVFVTRDLDRSLGRSGFLNIVSQQGKNNYIKGDYKEAFVNFKEAVDASYEFENIESYRKSFINQFNVIFAQFEEKLSSNVNVKVEFLEDFDEYESRIREFREGFRKKLIKDYIKRMETESPEYIYNEKVESIIIERMLRQLLSEVDELQAVLLFYKGMLGLKASSSVSASSLAYQQLSGSQDLFEKLSVFLKTHKPRKLKHFLRVKLNQGRAALASKNYRLAIDIAEEVIQHSYEYNLLFEKLSAHYLLAESLSQIPQAHLRKLNIKKIFHNLYMGMSILKTNQSFFYEKGHFLKGFFDFATSFYIKNNKISKALLVLENESEFYLMKEYMRYPLKFDRKSLQMKYNKIRSLDSVLTRYNEDEARLRLLRKKTLKLEKQKKIIKERLDLVKDDFSRQFPLHRPFVSFTKSIKVKSLLKKNQLFLRFLIRQNNIVSFCIRNKKTYVHQVRRSNKDPYDALLRKCVVKRKVYKDIFIIPDELSFEYDFASTLSRINKASPRPVLVTRINDVKQGFIMLKSDLQKEPLNIFNVDVYGDLEAEKTNYQSDILSLSLGKSYQNAMFSSGEHQKFNPRTWVYGHRDQSVVIVKRSFHSDFLRIMHMYEMLRLKGVGTVVFTNKSSVAIKEEILNERGRGEYSQKIVFGSRGFLSHRLSSLLISKAKSKMLTGEMLEKKNKPQKALSYYRIASSYLTSLPNLQRKYNIRNSLNILRVSLKLNDSKEAIRLIEESLGRKGMPFTFYESVLAVAAKTFTLFDDEKNVKLYLKHLRKKNIIKFLQVKKKLELLTLTQSLKNRSLRKIRYLAQDFEKHVASLFSLMAQRESPWEMISLFWKHGLYSSQRRYLNYLSIRGLYKNNISSYKKRIILEKKIFKGSILPNDFLDAINVYENIYTKKSDKSHLNEFRKRIVNEGKLYLKGSILDVYAIKNDVAYNDTSLYEALSLEERSFLFYLLSSNVQFDVDFQMRKSIDELIEIEFRKGSFLRAWRMTLKTCEKYIEILDLDIAFDYFNKLNKYKYLGFLDSKDLLQYTKMYVTLRANYSVSYGNIVGIKKVLADVRYNRVWNLYQSIPVAFTNEEVEIYRNALYKLLKRGRPEDYQLAYVSLLLTKNNSIKVKNWHALLNLEGWENAIRRIEAMGKQVNQDTVSLSTKISTDIVQKIPHGQLFVAIIPFKSGSYRVTIKNGSIQGDLLPHSGRSLHASQNQYLQLKKDYPNTSLELLQKTLRRFFINASVSTVQYYWLGHEFALAPLRFYKTDNLYQLTSLENLSRDSFPEISVKKKSINVFMVNNISGCKKDKDIWNAKLDSRIKKMETYEVGRITESISQLHVTSPITRCSFANVLRKFKKNSKFNRYFLSRVYFPNQPSLASTLWYRIQYSMSNLFRGPGVITLSVPGGINHAFMVREYYENPTKDRGLMRRFMSAYLLMRKKSLQTNARSGQYRLLTDRFILK